MTAEIAPEPGMDDPGNQWDTDETFFQVLAANAVFDRICGGAE